MSRRCITMFVAIAATLGATLGVAHATVPTKRNACAALGKAQVEAFTGLTATKGPKPPAFDGETACTWVLNDGEQTIRVWIDQTPDAKATYNENKNANTDAEPVPELGPKAFWSESGGTVYSLNGKKLVYVQYLASEEDPTVAKAGAIALAKIASKRA